MKRSKEAVNTKIIISVVLVVLLIVPAMALAQANFDLRYDPQSVATISGTIIATVDYNPGNPSMGPKSVIVLSNNRIYNVFLGPGSYLSNIGFTPTPGSSITVTGSLRNVSNKAYLVAQAVRVPSGTYYFRSSEGVPLFSMTAVSPPPIGAGAGTGLIVAPPPPVGGGSGNMVYQSARIPFNADDIIHVSGKVKDTYAIRTAEDNLPVVVARIEKEKPLGEDKYYNVVLAPMAFLTQNNIDLQPGDTLYVNGSRVNINGTDMIVATNVEEGESFISLRTNWGASLFTPVTPVGAGPSTQVPLIQFDPNNMVHVSGKIRNVYTVMTAEDNTPIVVANIEDENLTGSDRFYDVILGPQSFLKSNNINVQLGNTLFVDGSKVNMGNKSMIVATNVEEGNHKISLRTDTGIALFPAFTGSGLLAPVPPMNQ
ncbi:MAG: hypothetical protein ABFD46_08895 [Armatimonadota bacterium]